MSDYIPLIVNVGSGQIQEIPAYDNLDLSFNNISNVADINSTGTATIGTVKTDNYQYANGTSFTGVLGGSAVANIDMSGYNLDLSTFNETANTSNIAISSGSLTFDAVNGTIQIYDVTGNIDLNSYDIANVPSGGSIVMLLNIGTSGIGITGGSGVVYAGGDKTFTATSPAKDMLCLVNIGGTYYASLTKGYA